MENENPEESATALRESALTWKLSENALENWTMQKGRFNSQQDNNSRQEQSQPNLRCVSMRNLFPC